MAVNISTLVGECLAAFTQAESGSLVHESSQNVALANEFARFKIWVGNLSAHRPTGGRSLEYRLRDSKNLRARVISLLTDLFNELQELLLPTEDRMVISDDDDGIETDFEFDEDSPESQDTISDIKGIIDLLYRFALTLRNPAGHTRIRDAISSSALRFKPWDVDYVQTKHPTASKEVIERLARAMATRRQYIRYREDHYDRKAANLDATDEATTIATSLPDSSQVGGGSTHELDFSDLESEYTATSYAPTESAATHLRPPPLPDAGISGEPFQCDICCDIVSVESEHAWRQHVFEDVPPYKLNVSTRKWFKHVGHHLEELACHVLPSKVYEEDAEEESASDNAQKPLTRDELQLPSHIGQVASNSNYRSSSSDPENDDPSANPYVQAIIEDRYGRRRVYLTEEEFDALTLSGEQEERREGHEIRHQDQPSQQGHIGRQQKDMSAGIAQGPPTAIKSKQANRMSKGGGLFIESNGSVLYLEEDIQDISLEATDDGTRVIIGSGTGRETSYNKSKLRKRQDTEAMRSGTMVSANQPASKLDTNLEEQPATEAGISSFAPGSKADELAERQMTAHATPKSSEAGEIACSVCGAAFPTQGKLTNHLRAHAPQQHRLHICPTCDRRFQYRKDLALHMPCQSNRERICCKVLGCMYSTIGFSRQRELDRHMLTQHGPLD
ncbi:hypothetical protein CKM354_001056100 [Cercospora kikuchii]|uniref:C2H2-type domain-containing protein n=1 Tax=Cercospora kikuchii TaxID=84275 RepID=A0A9P3CRK2_9PEZI|nr:uncharacterized protein CKM354_001056100 [Cercospora kikuchii]GIZ47471.1 hypothetical protein CKM354_001056100 [Cercospora kikuchii]